MASVTRKSVRCISTSLQRVFYSTRYHALRTSTAACLNKPEGWFTAAARTATTAGWIAAIDFLAPSICAIASSPCSASNLVDISAEGSETAYACSNPVTNVNRNPCAFPLKRKLGLEIGARGGGAYS